MEKSSLSYREYIESIKEDPLFLEKGDEKFLEHPDKEARLLWAFHRPAGSHPSQVSDEDIEVSIMAFNHSRLAPYERLTRLNKAVLENEKLIVKIKNRTRMLFRSLVDEDFTELVKVLKEFPVLKPFALDQVVMGRRMNETEGDIEALGEFLDLIKDNLTDEIKEGVFQRLPNFEDMDVPDLKSVIESYREKNIHLLLISQIKKEIEKWMERNSLHTLQKKQIEKLTRFLDDK